MSIGNNIRRLRSYCEYTQSHLAQLMGVSQQNIGQYEKGARNPKRETLERMADCFDCPVGIFYEDIENLTNSELEDFITSFEDSKDTEHGELIYLYEKLNQSGKQKAIERVEELTEIPKYQITDDTSQDQE